MVWPTQHPNVHATAIVPCRWRCTNCARGPQVGKGKDDFQRAKDFVEHWGHFALGWTGVNPRTPVSSGALVAVTSKTLFMWSCNPLEVV